LRGTSDDPTGYVVPRAAEWYRFVLHNPSVAVALMAPANRAELDENLRVLENLEYLIARNSLRWPLMANACGDMRAHFRELKQPAKGIFWQ